MKKKHIRMIESIASQLPECVYNGNETKWIKGSSLKDDLLKMAKEKFREIDPNKWYSFVSSKRSVNHKLRLKKAFAKKGMAGIDEYLKLFYAQARQKMAKSNQVKQMQ